jgi:L1 cell adhesion molecule
VLQDDCFDSGAVTSSCREAQVGGLKLDLPLDEDDYLMPSAQQSQNNITYMDLIGDSKLPGQFITASDNEF